MPEVSFKTPADRSNASVTNVRSRINGDMELESTNYFKNWHFNDINEDGSPDCLRIGMPEVPDGWWVYLSEVGKDPSTLAAQNDAPIPIHQVSFVSSQSWVGGRAPVSSAFAAEIAAPDTPGYQIIDATRGGYEAGVWYVKYTWADYQKRQTQASFAASVTLSAGQGIRMTVPKPPDHAYYLNVYVGRDPATAQLQASYTIWFGYPESILLSGPFIKDVALPESNDTASFTPRIPGISLVSANTTLQPGTYIASASAVEASGTTAASASTDAITVSQATPNTAIEVTPGYDADCVYDDDPSDFTDASIRHKIFITKDGTQYLGYDPQRGSSERTLSASDALSIAGYTDENNPFQTTVRGLLARGTAPTQGNNGLNFDFTPPTLSPEGLAVLAPGVYWFAVSYAVRGKESLASTPVQVTLPSAKMLRLIFPDTVNVVPDANVFERDANGIPFSHVLISGNGSATSHPTDGSIILDTLGNITTATQTAPSAYVEFPINRSTTYQIGATENISALSAGSVVEELLEYDEFSTLLATTTLLTVTGTGTVKPISKFGPGGTAWQPATVTARLQHRFSGSTVNGKVTLSEFRALPTDATYRKFISPPTFVREPDQPDVPPQTPHPRYARRYTGRAPSTIRAEPPPSQVVDAWDFGLGTTPPSWTTTNTNPTAATSQVISSAAISLPYGWNIKKTGSSSAYVYTQKTFSPTTRNTLAVRAKFRMRTMVSNYALLLQVRNAPGTGYYLPGTVSVWQRLNGEIRLGITDFTGNDYGYYVTVGWVAAGDIADLELIVRKDATTNLAYGIAALGKNGATRVFSKSTYGRDWTGLNPTVASVGVNNQGDTSQKWEYDADDIVITDNGDSLGSGTSTPTLQPLELPDRPPAPAVVLEGEYDFETGTIPVEFTQTRTPADSTTTLVAQGASAINGSFGVRAADTGTTTSANVYIQRSLTATRTSLGARARYRVVGLPSTGEVQILALVGDTGNILGAISLDSTGQLYAKSYSAGVAGTSTPIATGIVNTNILHLDLVAQNTGTTGGLLSAWVQVNGSGLASARQLMYQKSGLDWSAAQVRSVRSGGFNESAAANTWSFDIDSILLTDSGETAFSENWNQGPIYQVHVFLPQGTPISDKWLLRGYREAVLPGGQYTAAIKARFRGILDSKSGNTYQAYPCYFTAYDTQGNAYPLGSVVGDSGVSGTLAWADYTRTFTIPSDCYEVRMDSRNIGEGEFTFQELAFSPGASATREVSYSTSGQAAFTLDTLGAVPNGSYATMGRKWQSVGVVVNTPAGTGSTTTYYSRGNDGSALSGPASDPNVLVQGRYADFVTNLTGDGTSSSRIKGGSPSIRYAIMNGSQQIATLLRYDRSEFAGGTIITELGVPYLKTPHGVNVLPSGRIARQRMGDPVGLLPDCIVGVFTEEAAREIEERALDDDFYIETRDKLIRVRFGGVVEFDPPLEGSLGRFEGEWRLWAEAETGDAEILELVDYTID